MRLLKKLSALIMVLALLSGTVYAEPEDILATPVDASIPEAEAGLEVASDAPDDSLSALASEDDALPGEAIDLALPAPEENEANAAVELSVSKNTTKAVYMGTVYQIKVPGKQVKSYKSSAKKIVAVSKTGRVTPRKAGKASITITLKNKKQIVLTLKVKKQPSAKKVTIKAAGSLTLTVGDTLKLSATVSPARASQSVTWKSSSKSVATVSDKGLVTAKKAGKAKITAKAKNGKTASVTVVVNDPPALYDLTAAPKYLNAGMINTVMFTVRCGVKGGLVNITLLDGNDVALGTMRDDGMEGDVKASDGVYTLVVNDLAPQTPCVTSYRAVCDDKASGSLELMAFMVANEENYAIATAQMDSVDNMFDAVEQRYADSSGYVDPKEIPIILSSLESQLSRMQAEGTILRYSVGQRNVYIKFPSGVGMIYEPSIEGMMGGGRNTSRFLSPMISSAHQEDNYYYEQAYNVLTDNVKPLLDQYGLFLGHETIPDNFTLATARDLGDDRIIWWVAHGLLGESEPYITLAQKYSLDLWLANTSDFNNDVIITVKDDYLAVNRTYISREKSLANDIIYLSICCSAGDNENKLLKTLVDQRGASLAAGFSNDVLKGYATELGANIWVFMTLISPNTHDYLTFGEALEEAQKISGRSDTEWAGLCGLNCASNNTRLEYYPNDVRNPVRLANVANQVFEVMDKNKDCIVDAKVKLSGKKKDYNTTIVVPNPNMLPQCYIYGGNVPRTNILNPRILNENTNNIPITPDYFGTYDFTISAKNYVTVKQTHDIREGQTYTFVLLLDGSCKGSATDKATGKKLSHVKVKCVFNDTGKKQTVYTNSKGAYKLSLDTPGTYTLTFSKKGYRDKVEKVTVSQDNPNASLNVQLESECLELSGLYGMNIRFAAARIGDDLNYRYDNLNQPYDIYYNKYVEISGWAGGSTTYVDAISIRNSDRYSLFGVKCGMSKQQAMEKMKKYKVGSSDWFPTSSNALYYVISTSGGYPATYVGIFLKNGKVTSVLYDAAGN